MNQRKRRGDARNEGTHCEAISPYIDAAPAAAGEVLSETIGLVKRQRHLPHRHLESNVFLVPAWGHAVMSEFIDVECKLGLHVLTLALGKVHYRAVFCAQLWELHRNSEVGSERVADRVANVVRQGADGERQFIGVAGVAKEIDDEVAAAH